MGEAGAGRDGIILLLILIADGIIPRLCVFGAVLVVGVFGRGSGI